MTERQTIGVDNSPPEARRINSIGGLALLSETPGEGPLEERPVEDAVKELQNLGLIPEEITVFKLLGKGLTNKQISNLSGIKHNTVRWYMRGVYAKLGLTSRESAVASSQKRFYGRDPDNPPSPPMSSGRRARMHTGQTRAIRLA